jgi:hypothetical protein
MPDISKLRLTQPSLAGSWAELGNNDCAIYQKGGYKEWDKKSIRKSLDDLGLNNLTPIGATDSIDEVTEQFIVEGQLQNFYLSPKMIIIRQWFILYLINHTFILTLIRSQTKKTGKVCL